MRRLAIALVLLFSPILFAQQSPPQADEANAQPEQPMASFFAETTVTATGSERNVFDIATPVTVIREKKIRQKAAENPADLLREQPGGDMNAVSRDPQFRGGSNVAGYIEGRHSSAGDLSGLSAEIDARAGLFTFQVGGTRRQSENYSAPSGRVGAIDLGDNVHVLDTGLDDTSAWGSITFVPSAGQTLRLRLSRYRAGETGFGYVPGEDYGTVESTKVRILYPKQSFDRAALSYSGALQRPWADSTNVQLYYQSNARQLANDIDIDIGPVAPGFPHSSVAAKTLNFSDVDTLGFRADAVKVLGNGRHIVTYGIEASRDDSYNTDFSTTTTTIRTPHGNAVSVGTDGIANAPNASNTAYGAFAQDEISIGHKLSVTSGVRFNSVDTTAKETPGWNVSGLEFSDRTFVGALSAKYQINPNINMLASWGRGFRAPNIIERLFNGPTPEGSGFQILNPALDSETSDNFDLGMKYSRANAFMEAVAFRNEIHGGIIQSYLSPTEIAQLDPDTRASITASHAQFVVQQRNTARLRS